MSAIFRCHFRKLRDYLSRITNPRMKGSIRLHKLIVILLLSLSIHPSNHHMHLCFYISYQNCKMHTSKH